MHFPDKQVGLCVAAMVSCGLAAGFRSDDLQDTRYFMELICSVPAEPLPMQILALASNAGKANQVSNCKLAVADSDGSRLTSCGPVGLLFAPSDARCSDDLCNIG